MVRFFTYEQYHNKKQIGSTKLRVHNLIKYWPEADLYKYGEHPEVLIFQKVYCTYDYKFPAHYDGIRILDTCDPDWKDTPDIHIKETLNGVHAVVASSQGLVDFLRQMTDKPVRLIKDRFDLSEFPEPKKHYGKTTKVGWFGYSHNAELLRYALPSIESRGLELIIISNDDPHCFRWATKPKLFEKNYKFIKYDQSTVYSELQKLDLVVFPQGNRPVDRFKSENKTIISQLLGIPVVKNADELDSMVDADARNQAIDKVYATIKEEYDCRKSVAEYKELIDGLKTQAQVHTSR